MTAGVEKAYLTELGRPRRWHFDWVLPALFQPRQTFARIASTDRGLASTPLLLLVLVLLVAVLISGSIKAAAAASGQPTLPPGFEYYPPETQAQFQQALAATNGPVFLYVLPAITVVLGVFTGWLVVGWLLHLLLTLMGGRSSNRQMLNIVAWASLPFVVRGLVRIGAMLASDTLLAYPGLSGFITGETGVATVFAAALLSFIDLYLLWHIVLLVIGAQASDGVATVKVWTGVLFVIVLVLLLRALPQVIAAQLSDLTIIRPFF